MFAQAVCMFAMPVNNEQRGMHNGNVRLITQRTQLLVGVQRGNPDAMKDYQQQVLKIWKKHNANPIYSMGSLFIQAPLFIGFYATLSSLARAKVSSASSCACAHTPCVTLIIAMQVPSMMVGGTLWFPDLTIADPYYVLPALTSAIMMLSVHLGTADGMEASAFAPACCGLSLPCCCMCPGLTRLCNK